MVEQHRFQLCGVCLESSERLLGDFCEGRVSRCEDGEVATGGERLGQTRLFHQGDQRVELACADRRLDDVALGGSGAVPVPGQGGAADCRDAENRNGENSNEGAETRVPLHRIPPSFDEHWTIIGGRLARLRGICQVLVESMSKVGLYCRRWNGVCASASYPREAV